MRRSAVAALAVVGLVLAGCSGGDGGAKFRQGEPEDTVSKSLSEAFGATAEQALEASRSTQGVVGVWMPDGMTYLQSFGEDAPNVNSPFMAGGTLSPATCAALLEIEDTTSLKFDRRVQEDVPRQIDIDDVTYQDLCRGTSGLADYLGAYEPITNGNPTRPWDENELFAQGLTASPLPGKGEDGYLSNSDTVLLNRALRLFTKETDENLYDDFVYSRAGMRDSQHIDGENTFTTAGGFKGLTLPRSKGAAVCDAEPIEITEASASLYPGGGSTVTTVTDVQKFYKAFFDGRFGGKRATQAAIKDPLSLVHPKRDAEGKITEEVPPLEEGALPRSEIAWGMEKYGTLYGRSSQLPGTMSAAFIEPESGFTVVIALNNSGGSPAIARSAAFAMAAQAAEEGGFEVPWNADQQIEALNGAKICK